MSITAYMYDPEELNATVDPPIGSGTNDHSKLSNRDADNQHPISAIDGLREELDNKLGTSELNDAIDQALTEAKESGAFKGEKGEPGKTPVVGEDYFTDTDKREIAEQAVELVEIPPVDLTGYAKTEDIPQKPEDIGAQPAGNYATVDQLPSVPVQSVNGKTGAVSLSASDVKARPDNWTPTAQDVGARPNTWMPTAQEVGALPDTYTPPNQTAEQVGADPKGTAYTAVSQHNASEDSHNDIRLALKAINDRLTAFFDSDDATLDELSEIVAYITSNKTLIEAITTSKVSVSDIVNNLTTNAANKPLSAAQGVVLKGLIDAVSNSLSDYALKSAIPTKASQLTNDAGYLTKHQDISGKLDRTELPSAINTALAQAAESGEFDGADGRGIKSIVRTSGNGAAGTTDTYTITYTDNTTSTLTVYNGKNGSNGTSVTVKSVSESTADGGSNVVTFSDGTTITIKNGSKGNPYTLTSDDKTTIVNAVIAALPVYNGEVV